MQNSQEVTAQIAQVKREIVDITASLDRLTDIQSMLGAKAELRDRTEVLDLLNDRLKTAQEQEKKQAALDHRAQLERTRDDATAEHAALDEAFEAEMLPLERVVLDTLDKLDEIALQRGRAEARRSNAHFELHNRQAFGTGDQELSTGNGWFSVATQNARSPVRQALFELFAARHRMYGRLQLPGQSDGYGMITAPTQREPEQPDNSEDFKAQYIAEITAKHV